MSSCKGSKSLSKNEKENNSSSEVLYKTLEAQQPDYIWFSTKGKIRIQTDDIAVGVSIQLRMHRDTAIWIRAEKFGFEVGRTLITPDSAFVINRINREFYAVRLTEFLQEYNAPFGFSDLQRLLAGGTIEIPPEHMTSEPGNEFTKLRISTEAFLGNYWFNKALLLDHSLLVDAHGRSVETKFADYRLVDETTLTPFERNLKLFDGTSTTEITLYLSEIQLNVPKSMRFEIPSHYERVD